MLNDVLWRVIIMLAHKISGLPVGLNTVSRAGISKIDNSSQCRPYTKRVFPRRIDLELEVIQGLPSAGNRNGPHIEILSYQRNDSQSFEKPHRS
jgi:hypothetical protein